MAKDHAHILAPQVSVFLDYSEDVFQHPELRKFIAFVTEGLATGVPFEKTILSASQKFPQGSNAFSFDSKDILKTFKLIDRYLYPNVKISGKVIIQNKLLHKKEEAIILELENDQLSNFASFLNAITRRESEIPSTMEELYSILKEDNYLILPPKPKHLKSKNVPSIHRLQHASLLYKTETTNILVDPIYHSPESWESGKIKNPILPSTFDFKCDAVLISHSHDDHFQVASLMMFAKDTPIFVPKVPRGTVICPSMESLLKQAGFTDVRALDWYTENIKIGDIEINILPFYGEQPTLGEFPYYKNCWNWGNTYLLRTREFTSWFLIDSGKDARGDMLSVASYVRKKFGPIDVLLSNLRTFNIINYNYITNGLYWITLSPDQMQRFHTMDSHCLTLGPIEVAKIAAQTQARYFLPYAHWWNEPGVPTNDLEELRNCEIILEQTRSLKGSTTVQNWNIGDQFLPATGQVLPFAT